LFKDSQGKSSFIFYPRLMVEVSLLVFNMGFQVSNKDIMHLHRVQAHACDPALPLPDLHFIDASFPKGFRRVFNHIGQVAPR
jgi:hypothetical protein